MSIIFRKLRSCTDLSNVRLLQVLQKRFCFESKKNELFLHYFHSLYISKMYRVDYVKKRDRVNKVIKEENKEAGNILEDSCKQTTK